MKIIQMDNMFRIKKTRESTSRIKNSEIVSGTLDSIHQNLISNIKETTSTLEDLKERALKIEEEIVNPENTVKVTRLQEELKVINKRLVQEDPLKDYYIQNADVF